jgi:hypothetical protein
VTYARSRIYALGEPPRPTPAQRAAVMAELRRRAWRELGLAILDPAEIADDWLRQAVRNEAQRQFGGGR